MDKCYFRVAEKKAVVTNRSNCRQMGSVAAALARNNRQMVGEVDARVKILLLVCPETGTNNESQSAAVKCHQNLSDSRLWRRCRSHVFAIRHHYHPGSPMGCGRNSGLQHVEHGTCGRVFRVESGRAPVSCVVSGCGSGGSQQQPAWLWSCQVYVSYISTVLHLLALYSFMAIFCLVLDTASQTSGVWRQWQHITNRFRPFCGIDLGDSLSTASGVCLHWLIRLMLSTYRVHLMETSTSSVEIIHTLCLLPVLAHHVNATTGMHTTCHASTWWRFSVTFQTLPGTPSRHCIGTVRCLHWMTMSSRSRLLMGLCGQTFLHVWMN